MRGPQVPRERCVRVVGWPGIARASVEALLLEKLFLPILDASGIVIPGGWPCCLWWRGWNPESDLAEQKI